MKIKKALCMLLTLAMVLSLCPAFAVGVGAEGEVTLLVDSAAANDNAARGDNAVYKTIAGAIAKAEAGDTIKLCSDISENVTVTAGKSIILDLNGCVLQAAKAGSVIVNNGDLTIRDSNAGVVRYAVDSEYNGSFETIGTVQSGLWTEITGGVIIGGNASYGGGIYSYYKKGNTSLTIEGGNIVGNTAAYTGGGIYVRGYTSESVSYTAAFKMTGGAVIGNLVTSAEKAVSGGGIFLQYVEQEVEISNATISWNTVTATGASFKANGGGLFISSGITVSMENCNINDNNVITSGVGASGDSVRACGGGISNAGNLSVKNTNIGYNTAEVRTEVNGTETRNGFGGGIYASGGNTVIEEGTEIRDNTAGSTYKSQGGGLYLASSTTCTMLAGKIYNNVANAGVENEAEGGGVCVTYDTTGFTVGGTAEITGNTAIAVSSTSDSNVYIRKSEDHEAVITIAEGVDNSKMKIGVSLPADGMPTDEAPVVAVTAVCPDKYAENITFDGDSNKYMLQYKNGAYVLQKLVETPIFLYAGEAYKDYSSGTEGITVEEGDKIDLPAGITYSGGAYTFTDVDIATNSERFLGILDSTATVDLEGTNKLGVTVNYTEKASGAAFYGIAATGDLTFTGSGSVEIYSQIAGISAKSITFDKNFTGTVTSYDNGTGGLYCCLSSNYGNITIENGTFNLTNYNTAAINSYQGDVLISGGTVNANGGVFGIEASNGDFRFFYREKDPIYPESIEDDEALSENEVANRNITISGGTVNASGGDIGIIASGNVSITEGTVTVDMNSNTEPGIQMNAGIMGSEVSISGGTVNASVRNTSGAQSPAFGIYSTVVTEISGGTVNASASCGFESVGIASVGTLTISGGTVKAEGDGGIHANTKVNITGGTVYLRSTNPNSSYAKKYGTLGSDALNISRGMKADGASQDYVVFKTVKLDNKDGVEYIVISEKLCCKITACAADPELVGTEYNTIAKAVAAVGTNSATIELNLDVTENFEIPTGADIVLNLNGHTITGEDSANEPVVYNKGTLEICGTATAYGTITGGTRSAGGGVSNEGKLKIAYVNVTGNTGSYRGGGIYNYTDAELQILYCNISNNTTTEIGGGIYNIGKATVSNTKVTGNTSNKDSGGIYNGGTLTLGDGTEVTGNRSNETDGSYYRYPSGGVYTWEGYGETVTTTLQGKVIISGNTTKINGKDVNANLCLDGHASNEKRSTFTIDNMTAGSSVGITAMAGSTVAPCQVSEFCSSDYSDYFFPDNSAEYQVYSEGSGSEQYIKFDKLFEISFIDGESNMKLYAAKGKPVTLPKAVYAGHAFAGWNTLENGTGTFISSPATFTADATYYAIWNDVSIVGKFSGEKLKTNLDSLQYVNSGETFVLNISCEGGDFAGVEYTLKYNSKLFTLMTGNAEADLTDLVGATAVTVGDYTTLTVDAIIAGYSGPTGSITADKRFTAGTVVSSLSFRANSSKEISSDEFTITGKIANDWATVGSKLNAEAVATVSPTMTVAPAYSLELVSDYISGEALVILYTDAEGATFTYNGTALNYLSDKDTKSGEKYEFVPANGTTYGTHQSGRVFAIVVDNPQSTPLTVASVDKLINFRSGSGYTTNTFLNYEQYNVNNSTAADLYDAVASMGTYNCLESYLATESGVFKNIDILVKADVNRDKKVDTADVIAILNNYHLFDK